MHYIHWIENPPPPSPQKMEIVTRVKLFQCLGFGVVECMRPWSSQINRIINELRNARNLIGTAFMLNFMASTFSISMLLKFELIPVVPMNNLCTLNDNNLSRWAARVCFYMKSSRYCTQSLNALNKSFPFEISTGFRTIPPMIAFIWCNRFGRALPMCCKI